MQALKLLSINVLGLLLLSWKFLLFFQTKNWENFVNLTIFAILGKLSRFLNKKP
jgi:hypothetical protein